MAWSRLANNARRTVHAALPLPRLRYPTLAATAPGHRDAEPHAAQADRVVDGAGREVGLVEEVVAEAESGGGAGWVGEGGAVRRGR